MVNNLLAMVTLREDVANTFLILGIVLIVASFVLFICDKKGWGKLFFFAGIFCILFATCNGFRPRWE